MEKKFKRSMRGRNRSDERGSVQVIVKLVSNGNHVRGNIIRSLTVSEATVTEVFARIAESIIIAGESE